MSAPDTTPPFDVPALLQRKPIANDAKIDTSPEAVEKQCAILHKAQMFAQERILRALSAERDALAAENERNAGVAVEAIKIGRELNGAGTFADGVEAAANKAADVFMQNGSPVAMIAAIRVLTPPTSPVEDLAWKCACGWSGSHHQMNANEAGIRVCPKCGASGGLASDGPLHPPTSRERDDEWAKDETGWLVERRNKDGKIDYLCGIGITKLPGMTQHKHMSFDADANHALRFARQQDAETVVMFLIIFEEATGVKSVEHMWPKPTAAFTAQHEGRK